MRIKLERIKIEYQDDRYFNLAFYILGQQYPARIWLSWRQFGFVCEAMNRDAKLSIGEFALTDGVNRMVEFFSDAIWIYEYDKPYPFSIPFPFETLRVAILTRQTEIDPEEIEALRLRHWPHTRVVWDEAIDKSVVLKFADLILPHVRGLRNIAKNYSDGELGVVHMYKDGSSGWKPEQIERGERPSFYWVIRRYRKIEEAELTESFCEDEYLAGNYHELHLFNRKFVADTRLVYKTEYVTDYGRIMVGGLIWHPNHKDPTTGSYSVHT